MKFTTKITILLSLLILNNSCQKGESAFDATGTFEAKEIIVSSESNGIILSFQKEEGNAIKAGEMLAQIDTSDVILQIAKIKATMKAIGLKTGTSEPQVAVLREQKVSANSKLSVIKTQIQVAEKEQKRVEALVRSEAATTKQLDDVSGQLDILRSNLIAAETQLKVIDAQIVATQKNISTQNRAITSETGPIEKQLEILRSQLDKAKLLSPIEGSLVSKYAYEGEFIGMGRPIAKIANLKQMSLRAYISAQQLEELELNQQVKVNVDQSDGYKAYDGRVEWISSEAEFTPKTIQTKDERANLVYAIKIAVPNDGYLKIGMYGEVEFPKSTSSDE